MRRFIYYDKDGIESYLAQITSGIPISETREVAYEEETEQSTTEEKMKHSNIGAKLAGIGAEIQEDVINNNTEFFSTNQLVKSLEEKVLSDYAFDKVFNYLMNNRLIKTENFKIGDVVSLTENVTFFDFDYFEKLFSETGAYNFSIRQAKAELKKLTDSLTKEQKQKIEVKQAIKDEETKIKNQEEERKSSLEILNMAKSTLPYARFVMTSNCLIVLNDNNFRDNPNDVAFKYGGNIQSVGYVTNIIETETKSSNLQSNAFSDLYKIVNQVLLSLYTEIQVVYVIHPLAMFY